MHIIAFFNLFRYFKFYIFKTFISSCCDFKSKSTPNRYTINLTEYFFSIVDVYRFYINTQF